MHAIKLDTGKLDIEHAVTEKWQSVLDLMADMISIPAALIMRVEPTQIKVFLASHTPGNPYEEDEKADLNTGLYCETVMKNRAPLLVANALLDPDWDKNPDIKLGMISYMGMPLAWPNQEIFGTICVLDHKENAYSHTFQQLLGQFRGMVERDLKQIYDAKTRAQEDALLRTEEAERVRQEFAVLRHGEQKALQALKDSEERWHFALEGAGDGVWDWDIPHHDIYFSSRCQDLLGLPIQEEKCSITKWQENIHPDDLLQVTGELEQYLNHSDGSFVIEHRFRKGKDWIWLLARGMVVSRNAQGKAQRMIGTYSDISQRKLAEAELQQLNNHLEERVAARSAELKAAMEQISRTEKQASLGRIVAGIAHELNTPIGNILLAGTLLKVELTQIQKARESRQLTQTMLDNFLHKSMETSELLERSSSLAGELVHRFKQIVVDQYELPKRIFHIGKTVEDLMHFLLPAAECAHISLKLDIPENLAIDSYPGSLEQILSNLVSNSLLHGFDGRAQGQITITITRMGNEIEIRYQDDGKGIDASLQDKVFDPFVTTRMNQGSGGLGLAIVQNLVEVVFKGSICLQSEPGQGATFTIRFPATFIA